MLLDAPPQLKPMPILNTWFAVTGVIADRFDAVKEKFITVTKIQKRAIMDKECNAALGSNRAGSVAIVPHQACSSLAPSVGAAMAAE